MSGWTAAVEGSAAAPRVALALLAAAVGFAFLTGLRTAAYTTCGALGIRTTPDPLHPRALPQ